MSVRFLADTDLNYAIVQGVRLREPSVDFRSANEAGLEGLPDPKVIELAAVEGRVLVSHDKRTMPVHFAARVGSGLKSPGVLLAMPSASVGDIRFRQADRGAYQRGQSKAVSTTDIEHR